MSDNSIPSQDLETDRQLALDACAGDEAAWRRIYDRNSFLIEDALTGTRISWGGRRMNQALAGLIERSLAQRAERALRA